MKIRAPISTAPAVIRAQARAAAPIPEVLELDLFGPVGEGDFTTKAVAEALREKPHATEIRIRLNTDGGTVIDGFAIYNLLKQSPARVVIDVIGAAMSAGSYILLAADHSRIASNGVVMIHEAAATVDGRASDFERFAGELKRVNGEMIRALTARSGKPEAEIAAMVAKETYFTAAEAVALGIVNEIIAEPASGSALAQFRDRAARMSGAPKEFLAAIAAATEDNGVTNAMTLEEILAALEALTPEEKQQVADALATMLNPDPAVDPATGEPVDPAAAGAAAAASPEAKALDAIRQLLGIKSEPKASRADGADAVVSALSQTVESLVSRADEADLNLLLASAAKRIAPAQAKTLREQFKAKAISLAGIRALVAASPEIAVGSAVRPGKGSAGSAVLAHNGKTWDALKPAERAKLKKDDPELHDEMRAAAGLK